MINIFDLARYTRNLFEHEPLNIFGSIEPNLFEKPENDWSNPIFHPEPVTSKPWVEYYCQSAINEDLHKVDDQVFRDYWKQYQSWADKWTCNYKENDKTESRYCEDNKASVKCSQW